MFLNYFNVLLLKINFKNKNKNIILMYFQTKNILIELFKNAITRKKNYLMYFSLFFKIKHLFIYNQTRLTNTNLNK